MKRFLYLGSLLMLAGMWLAGTRPMAAEDKASAKDVREKARSIDLVLCLDVSNSMDGLIAAAKNKLWDIVNDLAKIKPTPHLRVALYSYGHDRYPVNAGWVRKELDFGTDLDQVFKKLFELSTNGGTEYVARVCRDALQDLKWAPEKDALKILFVCGNEPATQDPEISLQKIADLARSQGVLINTIYCGNADDSDAHGWRQLASLAQGKFANIDHHQKVAVIHTPFDKELAELSQKINETFVTYTQAGKARLDNAKQQTENSLQLGASNAASRAVFQNSAFYEQSAWDLVDKLKKDPSFDVKKIPENELSDALKKLRPEERVNYVKEMAEKRALIQKRVEELSNQRNLYLQEETKKRAGQNRNAFDETLRQTIRDQAQQKGIEIPK